MQGNDMEENEENKENWWPAKEEYDPKISAEKWNELVTDKSIFTENSLIAFACLKEAGATTCTNLAESFGETKNFYNNNIWQTGERIYEKIRCELFECETGENRFWPICCVGKKLTKGGIVYKIRNELLNAFEKTGVLKSIKVGKFTWIPFYKELAQKLLAYKDNHNELKNILFGLPKEYINYFHDYVKDVHPFFVFGIFNRGLKSENRNEICIFLKENLNMNSNIPNDFSGIPTIDNRKSWWGNLSSKNEVNENWALFEEAIKDNFDVENFKKHFDSVENQRGTKWSLTMGLFWIFPERFLSLDSVNRKYLRKYNIDTKNNNFLIGENYVNFLNGIKEKMKNNEIKEKSFPEISYNAWKKTNFNEESQPMPTDNTQNPFAATLANTLLHVHNLILNGAPGTGKTHLVQDIAAELISSGKSYADLSDEEKLQTQMVQFHPSYDYTDFVEGLRPVKTGDKQVGFERRDGVFKEFCKRALQNLIDSKKSVATLGKEKSIEDRINDFIDSAISSNQKFTLFNGKSFTITDNLDDKILVDAPHIQKENLPISKKDIFDILSQNITLKDVKDVRLVHNAKTRQQSDSYVFVLCNEIKSQKQNVKVQNVQKVERKNFIFIIDEINRGELSKIFGELFFSIDPGYRGEKGRILTQYQNLIESGDSFEKGFFVPENVYIIGTMNDIDRSVDTMDFAFRRRFAFREIKAEENVSMLSGLGDLQSEALARMKSLNDAILKIDGLNSSYEIGASYFLKLKKDELNGDFDALWNYHLEGLLREYLRGNDDAETKLEMLKKAYDNVVVEPVETHQ